MLSWYLHHHWSISQIAPISRDPNDNLKTANCTLIGWGSQDKATDPSARFLMQVRLVVLSYYTSFVNGLFHAFAVTS